MNPRKALTEAAIILMVLLTIFIVARTVFIGKEIVELTEIPDYQKRIGTIDRQIEDAWLKVYYAELASLKGAGVNPQIKGIGRPLHIKRLTIDSKGSNDR